MRFIKLGIISVVVFAIILSAFSLLLPSTIHISRAIDINAPADSVYNSVSDLSRWRYWYADSSFERVSNPSTGKNATVSFSKTTITINAVSKKEIEATWQTANNSPLTGGFNIIPDPTSTITTVQWHFTHKVKWYPWEKFASILSDKALGPFMEKSLENLKQYSEKH